MKIPRWMFPVPVLLIAWLLYLTYGIYGIANAEDYPDALHIGADKHEISIGYTPVCKHYYSGENLNENIDFVMLSIDKWVFATYHNSHFGRSYFIGRTFRTDKKPFFIKNLYYRANFNIGLVTGYEDEIVTRVGDVTIIPFPTFEIGYKNFSIDTLVIPIFGCLLKYTF